MASMPFPEESPGIRGLHGWLHRNNKPHLSVATRIDAERTEK